MAVPEKKYCQKCCKLISDINTADYYSHIRIKYCKECGEQIHRDKASIISAAKRKQIRENNKLARQLNNQLLQENELLKRQLEAARERLEDLNNGKLRERHET